MFTGLVQEVGRLEEIAFQGEAGRLTLNARFSSPLKIGESIAVQGICLTLVEKNRDQLIFDVLRETFDKTALRDKVSGAPLNLERAIRMGDPLGGHLVSGHVDGTGELLRVEMDGQDRILVIAARKFLGEMVPKGSITVDGISLTLVKIDSMSGTFSVAVIPHTWRETSLSSLSAGMQVNLETDLIGKYVHSAVLAEGKAKPMVTWEKLRDAGFTA